MNGLFFPMCQSLSLGLLPLNQTQTQTQTQTQNPIESAPIGRVTLSDIAPFEGSPHGNYNKGIEALCGSLMRHNAVVIEVGSEDSLVVRCALESVRMFFKARVQIGKLGRGVYTYRAGRYVTQGHWYLADGYSSPGDVLLLTGRALSHATAGTGRALSHATAASYRTAADHCSGTITGGRATLTFRLIPQANAVLDCSPIAAAGHVIPQNYQPISVSQFMDNLSAEEDIMCEIPNNFSNHACESPNSLVRESSLRSILSDPLSGAILDDAMVVSCGHSFGGHLLKKVLEMAKCTLCNAEIDTSSDSLIPNLALRAAAIAVKNEDDRRLFHNAALRKQRKEENGDISADGDSPRQLKGVQYPFAVSEKVLIKGNRRTPDKFVGRQAVITSQCLNGWYVLKILDSGESVRLQYRSLKKLTGSEGEERIHPQPLLQSSC